MKSKVVFLIAMLLMLGILLSGVSFAINAMGRFDNIMSDKNKQDTSQNGSTDNKEDDAVGDDGGDTEIPTVNSLKLDNYFSKVEEGSISGYSRMKADDREYWQISCTDGKCRNFLTYAGEGYWLLLDNNPGWMSMPILNYQFEPSSRISGARLKFYYQVCRDGVWENKLLPMDGSVFSVYIERQLLTEYEVIGFQVDRAAEVKNGVYSIPLTDSWNFFVCISLKTPLDESISAVNFYLEPDYDIYY